MKITHISLVHIRDKKILLVLGKGKDIWQAPGGKKEEGETDEETLMRECKEELSIDIQPETITYLKTITGKAHSKNEDVDIEIKLYNAEFDGHVIPQAEIEKAEYFAFLELPKLPDIGVKFLAELKAERLIE